MVELLLNTISHFSAIALFIYGILLYVRSGSDRAQKMLAIALMLTNIFPLLAMLQRFGITSYPDTIFRASLLLSGIFGVVIFCYYPTAIIIGKRFNWKTVLLIALPFLLFSVLNRLLAANGVEYRDLYHFREIFLYFNEPNVWYRFVLYAVSQVYVVAVVVYSLRAIRAEHPRKKMLRIYMFYYIGMDVFYSNQVIFMPLTGRIFHHLYVIAAFTVITYILLFKEKKDELSSETQIPDTASFDKLVYKDTTKPLSERLELLMTHEKPYLNPELTLPELAVAVGTNCTTLSNMLHQNGYSGFQEYLNNYRVEEFKRIIDNGYTGKIEDVCQFIGFSNKNTFFRNFRRLEDMTPGQYIQLLKKTSE